MKKILVASLVVMFVYTCAVVAGQNTNSSANNVSAANANAKKRGPVFRASKEQIKQAQTILKQRAFYTGEASGKLDPDTRAGLKKYQEAESLKVTGTLNRATLEKMNITLTAKQKAM